MADIKSMLANMSKPPGETNGSGDAPKPAAKSKSTKQTIEKTYQKKSQLEHILLRPDTYIGSVEFTSDLMWIYDSDKEQMVQKQINYVPGLYKIYDEILVNAADNKQRDPKMDCIKIDINAETNTISVWNNGKGIPVVMHKDEKMFVPTMIFGHLLTSSNYNDEEEKVTGGRNGYGAKLCNIFSTKFIVETACRDYKQSFKQTWGSNMAKASEPKIKEFFGDDFTKITFCPDLTKFKMTKLDDDVIGLLSRRAFDVAASSRGVKVFLNGKRLPVKNFKDYIDLYIKDKEDEMGNPLKVVHEIASERWEIALTISDRGFQQVSFVNSIATTKGGRHVDHVTDMIVKQLIEVLKKKNKGGVSIKPFQVKNYMWIFVNCLIVNPTFDSQTKENMTLQVKSFGSKCTLTEKYINAVAKSGIVEMVLSWAKFKAQKELSKTSGKKQVKLKGIPKLEDANEAGSKNAYKCTLILTEGDSAKTLAVSGLGVVGRDHYGVFPLRGKLLNVREATHKQILENAEINNLIKILGLQYKMKYKTQDDLKTLRYGKLMIMTDQDQDGSHIKGLLINFIHHNWPELLRLDFVEEFITPIVKATKKNDELSFYSLPEFEEWKNNTANAKTYNIKYYKGLGTSTSKEAKEYFQNMARHRVRFRYGGQQDDQNIMMAFSKKFVEQRKEWLTNYMVETKRRKEMGLAEKYLYTKTTQHISYTDFINLELVLYSNMDNVRSIPSMVDGLKPGQRKVLFTCIKRNDKREVKVAQLAGSVAEHSAYHHGEVSLCGTIVNLAQNYVGSNNINLLEPRGQFGTRLVGGKDSASPRYIFTIMSPLTRLIFHPHDDALLAHEYDDNQKIEPTWYIPIIPMLLVNGADGIGTGWMTKIPNFNPREIIANIRRLLDGDECKPLVPWYKNFKGTIEKCSVERFVTSGEIAIIGRDQVEITELPIGTWTQVYKENVLEPMLHGNEKVKVTLSDYKEYNTDTTVKFVITCLPGSLETMEKEGLHTVFKLQSMSSITSMCAFDEYGALRRFDSVDEILKDYYVLRLKMYQKRKDFLEGTLKAEADKFSNQARFIIEKCNGTLTVENKKRKVIVDELLKKGFAPDPIHEWKQRIKMEDDQPEEEEEDKEEEQQPVASSKSKNPVDAEKAFKNLSDVKKFDYLLGMSMWMLTEERKNELLKQKDTKLHELEVLKSKTPSILWRDDLDALLEKLNAVEEKERNDELGIFKKSSKVKTEKPAKGKKLPNLSETLPSPSARRVAPVIAEDVKKKLNAINKLKEKKIAKKEKLSTGDEERDEFDEMIKSKKTLKDKLGTPDEVEKKVAKSKKNAATDGLKQTKLNFKKKPASSPGKGRNKRKGGSDSSMSLSDTSDIEFSLTDDQPSNIRDRAKRNVKAIKYASGSEESNSDGEEPEMFNNTMDEPKAKEIVALSSDSEPENPPKQMETSEDMFDSLVGRKSSKDDSPSPPRNASPTPVRKVVKKKRKKLSDSEDEFKSDDDMFDDKKSKKKVKNDSDSDEEFQLPLKSRTGRAIKPSKYKIDSDSD